MSEPQRIVEGMLRKNDTVTIQERSSIAGCAVRNDLLMGSSKAGVRIGNGSLSGRVLIPRSPLKLRSRCQEPCASLPTRASKLGVAISFNAKFDPDPAVNLEDFLDSVLPSVGLQGDNFVINCGAHIAVLRSEWSDVITPRNVDGSLLSLFGKITTIILNNYQNKLDSGTNTCTLLDVPQKAILKCIVSGYGH